MKRVANAARIRSNSPDGLATMRDRLSISSILNCIALRDRSVRLWRHVSGQGLPLAVRGLGVRNRRGFNVRKVIQQLSARALTSQRIDDASERRRPYLVEGRFS